MFNQYIYIYNTHIYQYTCNTIEFICTTWLVHQANGSPRLGPSQHTEQHAIPDHWSRSTQTKPFFTPINYKYALKYYADHIRRKTQFLTIAYRWWFYFANASFFGNWSYFTDVTQRVLELLPCRLEYGSFWWRNEIYFQVNHGTFYPRSLQW